jgi:PD-(D/E)XK nuclease superfamily
MTTYNIAPTDLTFLLNDCPKCFHHKVVNKSARFYSPMPSVFNKIDSCMKAAYDNAEVLGSVLATKSITVKSTPISITPTINLVIGGRMDAIGTFANGETLVVDFKTSALKTEHSDMYWRQLMAYAMALENPAKGSSVVVRQLALIAVVPESMTIDGLFSFSSSIIELDRNDERWIDFLSQVVAPLLQIEPEGKFNCPHCALRDIGYDSKAKKPE